VWKELTGKEIGFVNLDLARSTSDSRRCWRDQSDASSTSRAAGAPYSMRSTAAKRYTVDNNVRATHNVLVAIVASGLDIALCTWHHGVYGYGWSARAHP